MTVSEDGPRRVMAHLDGSRDLASLDTIGREAGLDSREALVAGIAKLAHEGLLIA